MTTAMLQKKLSTLLPKGEKSLEAFVKGALLLRLQETNQKIALFEGKYSKSFPEFKRMFGKTSSKKRYSYEWEENYMDWEALEMYKRELMRVLRSL